MSAGSRVAGTIDPVHDAAVSEGGGAGLASPSPSPTLAPAQSRAWRPVTRTPPSVSTGTAGSLAWLPSGTTRFCGMSTIAVVPP